jgi:hypothetical protein
VLESSIKNGSGCFVRTKEYKDGVALAPKYGYFGEGPSLCTFTGFLMHPLQSFLSVGILGNSVIATIIYHSGHIGAVEGGATRGTTAMVY